MPAEFYKSYTELVKDDFLRVLSFALAEGKLSVSMREGDIIVLYKKGDTRDPRNYRPITLLQSDHKILAKILTNRLKQVIGHIISKDRRLAFIWSPFTQGFFPSPWGLSPYHEPPASTPKERPRSTTYATRTASKKSAHVVEEGRYLSSIEHTGPLTRKGVRLVRGF